MSVQDVIKKSVLESGVFDKFDVPGMLTALAIALLLGGVIYLVYRKFYVGVIFSRSFAITLVGMTVLTCMVTLAISTNIVWYGWCIIYCTFSYSSQRPDGSSLSVLGDNDRNYSRCRYVCACGTGGSDHDCYDLFVLSQTAEWEDLYCSNSLYRR